MIRSSTAHRSHFDVVRQLILRPGHRERQWVSAGGSSSFHDPVIPELLLSGTRIGPDSTLGAECSPPVAGACGVGVGMSSASWWSAKSFPLAPFALVPTCPEADLHVKGGRGRPGKRLGRGDGLGHWMVVTLGHAFRRQLNVPFVFRHSREAYVRGAAAPTRRQGLLRWSGRNLSPHDLFPNQRWTNPRQQRGAGRLRMEQGVATQGEVAEAMTMSRRAALDPRTPPE